MQLSGMARKIFGGEGMQLSEDLGGADTDGWRRVMAAA